VFSNLARSLLRRVRRPRHADAADPLFDDCKSRLRRASEQPRRLDLEAEADVRPLHPRDLPYYARPWF
jgi:hypothetical protein